MLVPVMHASCGHLLKWIDAGQTLKLHRKRHQFIVYLVQDRMYDHQLNGDVIGFMPISSKQENVKIWANGLKKANDNDG